MQVVGGWVLVFLGLAATQPCGSEPSPPGRVGLSIPGLIGLTRIGSNMFGGYGGDEHVVSPDGARVAVVVQKGNLAQNTREFSLLVFHTAKVFKHPKPDIAATFATSSNRPGIAQLAWLSNEVLSFIGEPQGALSQVYTIDLRTQELVMRTHAAQAVITFKAIDGGAAVIYATEAPPADTSGFAYLRAHGFAIPSDVPVADVIAGKWDRIAPTAAIRRFLHIVRNGEETSVDLPNEALYGSSMLDEALPETNLSLSPSRDVALVRYRPSVAPAGWTEYEEKRLRKRMATGAQYAWWIVLDLQTGSTRPLTGGPNMNFSRAPTWTPDGRAVLLVDDLLSLEGVGPSERNLRAQNRLTAEVDVRTGTARIVPVPSADPSITPLIEVQEGPTQPWRLVALNPRTGKKEVIFDPNPDLMTKHRLAPVTLLNWTTKSGAELTAGLYWPLNYNKSRRYPLLIQTHGFKIDQFAPDGYSTTGYAAQPLAANGVLVLQAFKCTKDCDTPQHTALGEGERVQEGLEGLIDRLDSLGLIDRTKVALQGYSRACFHELYFMTHSSYPISAMTCTDGVDESYMQYLLFVPPNPAFAADFDSHNGGPPFGPTLKAWMERAPAFNLDRIHAPVMLTALTNGSSLLEEWEPYAGLIVQGKPAELKFIPDAVHNIVRPWERFTSQQGAVDWFRFWLQDYERTVPVVEAEETAKTLSSQYARWHKLRELQKRQGS
jgi:hypothetical protein